MNKRQKKKEYKKLAGANPPKWMIYHGENYHNVMQKPWGGLKAALRLEALIRETKRQQETIQNLEGFNQAMTERRISCRKRNWKKC